MTILNLSGLNEQPDHVKAEVCLLAWAKKQPIPVVEFTSDMYKALRARVYPGIYTHEWDGLSGSNYLEYNFIKGLVNNDFYEYPVKDNMSLAELTHTPMFNTLFGTLPYFNDQLKERLLEVASSATNVDLIGECLLALKYMNVAVPDKQAIALYSFMQNTQATWQNYHPHLVAELYFT